MNRDAQEVNEIFEDVTVRLFASRISRRHVEKKRRVEKGKRKGKKQRSWQREYVPRFLSRGISWMIAGDLLEPYWYLSNLESYGAAVGVRSISRKVDTQILAHPCVIQEIRRLEKSLAVHCLIVLLPRTFPPIWPLHWNDSFGSCILVQWRKKEKKKNKLEWWALIRVKLVRRDKWKAGILL